MRRKVLPVQSKNAEEVYDYVESTSTLTCDGENFVLRSDRQQHFIIFSCLKNLHTLVNASTLYVDEINFSLSSLMVIIRIFLVFALMDRKTIASYTNVFQIIVVNMVCTAHLKLYTQILRTVFVKQRKRHGRLHLSVAVAII